MIMSLDVRRDGKAMKQIDLHLDYPNVTVVCDQSF